MHVFGIQERSYQTDISQANKKPLQIWEVRFFFKKLKNLWSSNSKITWRKHMKKEKLGTKQELIAWRIEIAMDQLDDNRVRS